MTEVFSDIPLWTLGVWTILVVIISVYFYRRKSWVKEISAFKRILLISLRSASLFIIGLLLLGILLKGTRKEVDLPLIITLVDDSQSMLNYADSSTVKENTISFVKALKENTDKDFNTLIYGLDNTVQDIDSVSFNNRKTNLSKGLNQIYNSYYGRNIGAVIVLSDGNFNTGTSPLSIAEKFKRTPFYTLSVGDTIQKVDHLIKSVTHNEIAFLNNSFPVEISVEGNKTNELAFDVSLYKDGVLLDKKRLQHDATDYSLVKTEFLIDAKQLGIHEYVLKITEFANEFNVENNEKAFFVEVLDDRSKVLLLAEALNPDVSAVKSALVSENNLEVETYTSKDLPENLKGYDLVVWFDPGVALSAEKVDEILKLDIPSWFFISPQTSAGTIERLRLQSTSKFSTQYEEVGAAVNQNFNLFKLSPETRRALEEFPPVKVPYGDIQYTKSNAVLAYQRLGNIVKRSPLMYFGEKGKVKYAVNYGIGVWNWKTYDYQRSKTHASFNEIVRKTVQYLIVKENTSRLRISMPSIASSDGDFIIGASFYNESFEPITSPEIKFVLEDTEGKEFEYSFLALDNEYRLDLGRLEAGRYNWKTSTTFNGENFEKTGGFAIRDLDLEKFSTRANHQLMAQLAANNDGEFALLRDGGTIISKIKSRDDITPVAYESASYNRLIDYLFWLILLVVLVTAEWFIRRYSGSY